MSTQSLRHSTDGEPKEVLVTNLKNKVAETADHVKNAVKETATKVGHAASEAADKLKHATR
jgi:hypothetical protein